jgi:hypothetical protein
MSNDVIDQLRTYLDYAAGESKESPVAGASAASSELRWYRRGPALAAFAALLVMAVGVPALLLGSNEGTPQGSGPPMLDPLDVGVERVWPDSGFVGSPDEIAAEFAKQALGWIDVQTVSDSETAPGGPVWTTIHHAGSEALEVLSIPIGEGRRVLTQVGSQIVTAGVESEEDGQSVGIPPVVDARSAILHVRFVEPDRVEVVWVNQTDLVRGRVEIASTSLVGGIVIVYLDADGNGLTAIGGHFGPFDTPSSPDTTMAAETSSTLATTTTIEPSEGDLEEDRAVEMAAASALVATFIEFANGPTSQRFSNLPLASSVSLGLGPQIIRPVDSESLQDTEAWVVDVAEFRAHTGPFSPLAQLQSLDAYTVEIGEHPHCAGPPQPPPSGFENLQRVSVQPLSNSIENCLDWTTVDFYVNQSGQVEAITMDLWEP